MAQHGLTMWLIFLMIVCTCQSQDPNTDCLEDRSLDIQCIRPNSTSQVPCSGRGECICGFCECNPRRAHSAQKYSGSYCECDDYSCPFYNMQICGGRDRGRCVCGRCECMEGYAGDSCTCPTSSDTCMTAEGKICNGVGECVCGVCQCSARSSFRGPTCEECPTCPGLCSQYKECAQCKAFGAGSLSSEECYSQCPNVQVVDAIDINRNERLCKFADADGCLFSFTYQLTSLPGSHSVKVQKTKECPYNEPKNDENGAANGFQLGIVAMVLRSVCGVILHNMN